MYDFTGFYHLVNVINLSLSQSDHIKRLALDVFYGLKYYVSLSLCPSVPLSLCLSDPLSL